MLYLYDRGETDHKILAVGDGSPLSGIRDIAELDRRYPGITAILATWFANYKGPGTMRTDGFGDADAAQALIDEAIAAFAAGTP